MSRRQKQSTSPSLPPFIPGSTEPGPSAPAVSGTARGRWLFPAAGLVLWILVQGALTNIPLWQRALPPEFDDAIGYLTKTRQMQECFTQDCPALESLRAQLLAPSADPEVARQHDLAATRIFPVYHFLYSLVLLGLTPFGLDISAAHDLVWTLAPVFFGLGFAWLLTALWGRVAGGLGLVLAAFKVYPSTGLHLVQPGNLTMGLAVCIWARLIARNGQAPWTLALGSLLLVGSHPVGRIFAVMAVVMALLLSTRPWPRSLWLSCAFALAAVAAGFVLSASVSRPQLINPAIPLDGPLWLAVLSGAVESLVELIASLVNLEQGFFGSLACFFLACFAGFLTTEPAQRNKIFKVLLVYVLFLLAMLFYVEYWAAGGVYRIWIPFLVIFFGAIGQALRYTATASVTAWRTFSLQSHELLNWIRLIPVTLFALLLGYCVQTTLHAAEQIGTTIEHATAKEPLRLDPAQVSELLAQAGTGDSVLYTSMIVMPYYFLHGAMRLGAVYYHPALREAEPDREMLKDPALRFAVGYNPTVFHPSFVGVNEDSWWISYPDFRFSPLSTRSAAQPLNREGWIPARELLHIDIRPAVQPGAPLRALLKNRGKATALQVLPLDAAGTPRSDAAAIVPVARGWSGWLELGPAMPADATGLRILLPAGSARLDIGGLTFGPGPLHWPWQEKAELTFLTKDPAAGAVPVSFDPARLLPEVLSTRTPTVLNDSGSSVLLRLQ